MKKATINQRYEITVPDHIAEWDILGNWEVERFLSMEQHLSKGLTLLEVGAEQGWQSAVVAKFVGPENMVLIEPDLRAWPNIRQTWEANGYEDPKACFAGCFGNESNVDTFETGWPESSKGELQIDRGYSSLINDGPRTTIDNYVEKTGIVPDALNIDVEGAEADVLRGAEATLKAHKPLIWVSVHKDLMEKYEATPDELSEFMRSVGYESEHLGTDHESHHYLYPKP